MVEGRLVGVVSRGSKEGCAKVLCNTLTLGSYWQLLAALGSSWQLLVAFLSSWQHLVALRSSRLQFAALGSSWLLFAALGPSCENTPVTQGSYTVYSSVPSLLPWINSTIVARGGMDSCGYILQAPPTIGQCTVRTSCPWFFSLPVFIAARVTKCREKNYQNEANSHPDGTLSYVFLGADGETALAEIMLIIRTTFISQIDRMLSSEFRVPLSQKF